jgi:hypothetical protein
MHYDLPERNVFLFNYLASPADIRREQSQAFLKQSTPEKMLAKLPG